MKNKRIEILSTVLDVAIDFSTTIEIDVPMTYVYSTQLDGTVNEVVYHPREIQIINDCGTEIEWLIIANAEEYAEYLLDQTNFSFVRLPSGEVLQDDSRGLQRAYKFLVRKNTFGIVGTATADLCIEFLNYGLTH